ncbi:MAG: serine/threonine protein kinase [Deltaproteobacteria bacterium]|nr:serine/threonine protein kinase [Deltaproteobacteria bacterium]
MTAVDSAVPETTLGPPRDALAEARWAADAEARLFGGSPAPVMLGRFEIRGRLGMGGLGIVYEAYDRRLDREVALKRMRPESRGPRGAARLLREAQALARLSDPHVVTVFEAGELDDDVYVAMELVRGTTLRAWLQLQSRPWRTVLGVLVQAGHGLAAAHAAGLVHRDFKPDNVLVRDDGHALVVDFGLARGVGDMKGSAIQPTSDDDRVELATDLSLTRAGAVLGTPRYMAPEQHDGALASAAADQYALCVTAYEALWGAPPFDAAGLESLAAAKRTGLVSGGERGPIPAQVRRAIVRGLAPDPAARWPSLEPLLLVLEDDPIRRRRRRLAVALITLFVGVVLTGAVFQGIMFYDYIDAAKTVRD